MKKLLVFFLLLGCVCATYSFKIQTNPLFSMSNVDKVCIVSKEHISDFESVVCGDKVFNFCTLSQAKDSMNELKTADSYQFYISDIGLDVLFEELKFELVSSLELDGIDVYCGYSPYGDKSVKIDDKVINVQVAAVGEKIIAGFPMILTGY